MANEVLAAVIQGCCTMAAAAIAVGGAFIGLRSWRKEVPGRRRLDLAEKCLALAYRAHGLISDFSYEVGRYIRDDLRLGATGWPQNERNSRYQKVVNHHQKIIEALDALRTTSKITDLYFEQELARGHGLMCDYYMYWGDKMVSYEIVCNSTRESTPEKAAYIDDSLLAEPKAKSAQLLRDAPLDFYEEILKPHLGILATKSTSR